MTILMTFPQNRQIRINLYEDLAPATCAAFLKVLPLDIELLHARFSGPEIWSPEAPLLDVIQENASIFAEAGEIVIGPVLPKRNKIAGCIGIFYGEGKLLDCGNIFGRVVEQDMELFKEIGEEIWRGGVQVARFRPTPDPSPKGEGGLVLGYV